MANEIINKSEKIILVQFNQKGDERAMYQDNWSGSYMPTDIVSSAKQFETYEDAKNIADVLNMLYGFSGNMFNVKPAKQVIECSIIEDGTTTTTTTTQEIE